MPDEKDDSAQVSINEHTKTKEEIIKDIFTEYAEEAKLYGLAKEEAILRQLTEDAGLKAYFGEELYGKLPFQLNSENDAYAEDKTYKAFAAEALDTKAPKVKGLTAEQVEAVKAVRTAFGDGSARKAKGKTDGKGPLGLEPIRAGVAVQPENSLSPPHEDPEWKKFMVHMTSGFALLLEVGSVLCFVAYGLDSSSKDNLYLGIVLISVVLLNAVFSYYQDRAAEGAMAAFKEVTNSRCAVYRNGKYQSKLLDASGAPSSKDFGSTKLVVGDLVHILQDCKVPADVYIIQQDGLKVNNSNLTGEPDPLPRGPCIMGWNTWHAAPDGAFDKTKDWQNADTKNKDLDKEWESDDKKIRSKFGTAHDSEADQPFESENLCFFGTDVVAGNGIGIVIRMSDETSVGQIAKSLEVEEDETLMQIEIRHFIHIVSGVAIFLGVTFFILSVARGDDFIQSIVFMIGIIVANVPEGLLATITVALTLTAKLMGEKNVQVKEVETVETLGSITTIASDKTGTLTQNNMTTYRCAVNGELRSCNLDYTWPTQKDTTKIKDIEWDGSTTKYIDVTNPVMQRLLLCGLMCRRTVFVDRKKDEKVTANGKPDGKQVWEMPSTTAKSGKVLISGEEYTENMTEAELDRATNSGCCARVKQEWTPAMIEQTIEMWESEIKARASKGDASEEGFIRFLEELRYKERELIAWTKSQKDSWFTPGSKICRPVFMYDIASAADKAKSQETAEEKEKGGKQLNGLWEATVVEDAGQVPEYRNLEKAQLYKDSAKAMCFPRKSGDDAEAASKLIDDSTKKFPKDSMTWKFDGSNSEMYKWAASEADECCPYIDLIKAKYPGSLMLEFNSSNKYMVVVREMEPGVFTFFIKGGSDVITNMFVQDEVNKKDRSTFKNATCDKVTGNIALTDANGEMEEVPFKSKAQLKVDVDNCIDEMSEQGERVLGFIEMTWTKADLEALDLEAGPALTPDGMLNKEVLLNGKLNEGFMKKAREGNKLLYLGNFSLMDPPRDEVPAAINLCHSAGIRVVMVTGDHPKTAKAIAAKIGIVVPKGNAWARFITNEAKGQGQYFDTVKPREGGEGGSGAKAMQFKTEWRRSFEKARLIEQLIIFGEEAPAYKDIVQSKGGNPKGKPFLEELAKISYEEKTKEMTDKNEKTKRELMQGWLKTVFKDTEERQGDATDYEKDCLLKLVAAVPNTAEAKEAKKLLDRMVDNFKGKYYDAMRRNTQDPTWDLDDITPAATKKEAKSYVPEMAAKFYSIDPKTNQVSSLFEWDGGVAKKSKDDNQKLVTENLRKEFEPTEPLLQAVRDAEKAETPLYTNLRAILKSGSYLSQASRGTIGELVREIRTGLRSLLRVVFGSHCWRRHSESCRYTVRWRTGSSRRPRSEEEG
eukprot:SAG31_NODE_1853_length_7066_cov_3.058705_3_plen_1387_part_00